MIDPRRDSGINTLLCNNITFHWNVSLLTTCNLRNRFDSDAWKCNLYSTHVVIQVKHASSLITKVDCML
jgi:hypothetical protein